MGEPLKDKRHNWSMTDNKTFIYYEGDLKSAVEWLRKKVIHCRENDEETQYDIDTIQELINQAFPDLQNVTKEGN